MENIIIQEYLEGKSNKELSEKFKLHRTTIQRILKRNNVILRKTTETSRKNKIINFNGDIVSNNDAYILGLIWSDGNLSNNNIEISLHEKDKQILTEISNYIYGYEKLSYRKSKKMVSKGKIYNCSAQYRFLISSKDIVEKLKKVGLLERKSLICRFPNILETYNSHFIRGVFDGDGCIFISKKYKGTNRVTIVSNLNFCEDLKSIIEKELNINVKIQNKTNNVKTLSITGNNQIRIFMNWIYKDADLKMNRKYEKFKNEFI